MKLLPWILTANFSQSEIRRFNKDTLWVGGRGRERSGHLMLSEAKNGDEEAKTTSLVQFPKS